jgi:DNA-binding LytR/AlgR family response regulator
MTAAGFGQQESPAGFGQRENRAGSRGALVVDDEAPALDELTYLLRTTFSIAPVDTAQNPGDAFRLLQKHHYDVVFLDVRMPMLDGIELAHVLRRFAIPPAIVFVTAYDEYAVRAFDIGACDYLLKPVSRERLRTALERALGHPPERPDALADDDSFAAIPVETAGRTRFISREQVRWVEAEGDYVRLHLADGDAHLVRIPISHLEERWSAYGFVRIHRGYLVPLRHITEFSVASGVHTVTVAGRALPVSRRHVRDVRDRMLRAGWRDLLCRQKRLGSRAPGSRAPAGRLQRRPGRGGSWSGGPTR